MRLITTPTLLQMRTQTRILTAIRVVILAAMEVEKRAMEVGAGAKC